MSRAWNRHTLLLAAVTLAASLCAGATAPGLAQEEGRPAARDVPPRKVIRTQPYVSGRTLAQVQEPGSTGGEAGSRSGLRRVPGGSDDCSKPEPGLLNRPNISKA